MYYGSVPFSLAFPVSQHAREQHPDSVWPEWNRTWISINGNTCVLPFYFWPKWLLWKRSKSQTSQHQTAAPCCHWPDNRAQQQQHRDVTDQSWSVMQPLFVCWKGTNITMVSQTRESQDMISAAEEFYCVTEKLGSVWLLQSRDSKSVWEQLCSLTSD